MSSQLNDQAALLRRMHVVQCPERPLKKGSVDASPRPRGGASRAAGVAAGALFLASITISACSSDHGPSAPPAPGGGTGTIMNGASSGSKGSSGKGGSAGTSSSSAGTGAGTTGGAGTTAGTDTSGILPPGSGLPPDAAGTTGSGVAGISGLAGAAGTAGASGAGFGI